MSLPGVYEDMKVPDAPRDGVRKEGVFIRNCYKSFIEIQIQETCQLAS